MGALRQFDPEVYKIIKKEEKREAENLELIASENFVSQAVLEAQGCCLTNKYAEGYPGRRWYGGCGFVDEVEALAIERARKLFDAEHANVQPHSGSQANMAGYFAMLEPGDTVMALDLACGGHLTHGHKHNFSGRLYNLVCYGVDEASGLLDYGRIEQVALECRPKMVVAGASAYSRIIDFPAFRRICDKVGAYLFVDMAHIAGLVAAGVHPSPLPYADFVASTTHKTLRGPRSGFILCRKEFARRIDMQVFPGIQGGPLMHIIAAKAVAFKEAMGEQFRRYQRNVVANARRLAHCLRKKKFFVVSGGTDTHLFLVDLRNKGISGKDAADCLDAAGITVNKNLIPYDPAPAVVTSGIRLGAAAVTTRGMGEGEMDAIGDFIARAIKFRDKPERLQEIKTEVVGFLQRFPINLPLTNIDIYQGARPS
ncbi:MAG: serine hydroxymethyltransferase [Candidatus Omnitrophota bacterium]